MDSEIMLDERVQVVAVFGTGLHPCRPVRFRRSTGREVTITEIGLCHPTVHGRRTVHVFDVTDGGADYRLVFDTERLTWMLVMEADHGN